MKTQRIFIKEAQRILSMSNHHKVSGDILMHEFLSSDVYKHYDRLKYKLDDADKSPMLMWSCGEPGMCGNKTQSLQHLEECWQAYCMQMLEAAKEMQTALENELKQIK